MIRNSIDIGYNAPKNGRTIIRWNQFFFCINKTLKDDVINDIHIPKEPKLFLMYPEAKNMIREFFLKNIDGITTYIAGSYSGIGEKAKW